MKIFSYGGGIQSFCILLMIQKGIFPKPNLIAMADMSPFEQETLNHAVRHALPIAQGMGVAFKIVQPKETLYEKLKRGKVVTPFWFQGDKRPQLVDRRSCTFDFKVELINNLIPRRAWATMWLGISADELRRVRGEDEKLSWGRMRTNYYPLIEKDMTRQDCIDFIQAEGFSLPPKSACDLCPFSSKTRLLTNIAKNEGAYERIQEIQTAWHENKKHGHKFLTQFLESVPTPQEAQAILATETRTNFDNSGACGVCEF